MRLSSAHPAVMPRAAGLAAFLLAGVLMASAASGQESAPRLEDPSATGAELVSRYTVLVKEKNVEGLRDFLSDAFMIQRANGMHQMKSDYLESLPTIGDYTISEVTALQSGNVLTIRWLLTLEMTAGGTRFSDDPAPRLSTFIYQDGKWCLASHANFNPPATAANAEN